MTWGDSIDFRAFATHAARSFRQPVVVFGLVIIAFVWIGVIVLVDLESQALRSESERDASNFSLVVRQDVTETVVAIDRTLKMLRWIDKRENYNTDWADLLATNQRIDNIVVQASVTDAKGLVVASSMDPHPKKLVDISDRAHFRAQLDPSVDKLYISPVVVGRVSGQATVQFSRKRTDDRGAFLGVLVLSLPATQFEERFAKLDLGAYGGLALVGDDGFIRAGSGVFRTEIGGRLDRSDASLMSGFVSEQPIPGAPLSVIARLPGIEADGNWRFRKSAYLLCALLVSLAAAIVTLDVAMRRQRYEESILHISHFDSLTHLANRHSLSQRLQELHDPTPTEAPFALLIVDLDRFKMVNDAFGHTAGDELLKQVGDRLRELAGPEDLVARLGGDEFAFVKVVQDYATDAGALAERINLTLSRPFPLTRATLQIGASIGVALGGRDARDATSLLKAADLALYAAKAAGRGRHYFYAPAMSESAMRRMRIETGLRSALVNDELRLVYQPIVSIATEEIQSFEALMRWRRTDGPPIGPAEFIPVAEEIGVIGEFGAWALRRACAEIAALPGSFRIAVNCSPLQFATANYPETVRWALIETGLPAHRLTIEITESMLIKDRERILEQLNALRALGVEVSIDDFGTGYSCLSYLEIYPISALKIDRQFVNKIGERPEARDTLRAIVDLAASFGMRTIAEGVETAEQLQALRELGCAAAQGYYFGRPAELARFVGEKASLKPAA